VNVAGSIPSKISAGMATSGSDNRSFVRIAAGETKNPAAVYPGFSISDGEVKIIVEIAPYFYTGHTGCRYLNGSVAASNKKVFGFFVVDPLVTTYVQSTMGRCTFFSAVAIFTPKPGLFDEIPPSEG
jgi:hypothetical protein